MPVAMTHYVQDSHLYYTNANLFHHTPQRPHPYARPTSTTSTCSYATAPNNKLDAFNRMKLLLKTQLARVGSGGPGGCALPNMPAGFPLQYVVTDAAKGAGFLSETAYQFTHDLSVFQAGRGGEYALACAGAGEEETAVIAFSDPYSTCHRAGRDRSKFVWSVSLPTFEAGQLPDVRVVAAEVHVDRMVMDSAYGHCIRADPRIICRALATSLEYGMKINITLADYPVLKCIQRLATHIVTVPGDVIYLGTTAKGEQQVLNVLDGRNRFHAKFSSAPLEVGQV